MENDLLKLISQSTIYSLSDVNNAYSVLNKSFDKLLIALPAATCLNQNIVSFAANMEKILNTKIKLTFWQKIKKCWEVLLGNS